MLPFNCLIWSRSSSFYRLFLHQTHIKCEDNIQEKASIIDLNRFYLFCQHSLKTGEFKRSHTEATSCCCIILNRPCHLDAPACPLTSEGWESRACLTWKIKCCSGSFSSVSFCSPCASSLIKSVFLSYFAKHFPSYSLLQVSFFPPLQLAVSSYLLWSLMVCGVSLLVYLPVLQPSSSLFSYHLLKLFFPLLSDFHQIFC